MGLNQIRASNGNGEAVRASVIAIRATGSETLKVDALTNWPSEFIATSGILLSDGTLDPATVTVFSAHIVGSDIIIDEFAPGYSDEGNSVGDVVLVKPTTMWADNIADFMAVSHTDNGNIKQLGGSTGIRFAISDTQPAPEPDTIIVWFEPLD